MRLPFLVLALAACGDDPVQVLPDAPAPPPDADALHCADPPANPSAPGRYKIYLAMEGITLTKTPTCSDSKTNCTNLITADTVTVPQFLPNTLGRQEFINEILRLARVRLAPYSIDIVTERPASGDYHLFVLGGDSNAIVGASAYSVSPSNCLGDNHNMVDLMFDHHFSGGAPGYASTILSDLGAISGLGLTAVNADCMCRGSSVCNYNTVCTFGTAAMTDPMGPDCGHGPVQDEPALLKQVLGCR